MVKRIKKVIKGKPTRERRKIIVVGTEGKNKTEEIYLRNLEKKQSTYHFIFASGNDTDPVNIVKNTINKAKDEALSFKQGDMAVSMFDLDVDKSKEEQLLKAHNLASPKNIVLVTSNPCFEIWFLAHFVYTTKSFNGSNELIKDLKCYISAYSKNQNYFETLYPKVSEAIRNCERLDKFHMASEDNGNYQFWNPQTDVYKLVMKVLGDIILRPKE